MADCSDPWNICQRQADQEILHLCIKSDLSMFALITCLSNVQADSFVFAFNVRLEYASFCRPLAYIYTQYSKLSFRDDYPLL